MLATDAVNRERMTLDAASLIDRRRQAATVASAAGRTFNRTVTVKM